MTSRRSILFAVLSIAGCTPHIGDAPSEEILLEAVITGTTLESVHVVGRYPIGELDDTLRPEPSGELQLRLFDGTNDLLLEGYLPDPRTNAADNPLEPTLERAELMVLVPAPSDGEGMLSIDLGGTIVEAPFSFEIDAPADGTGLVIAATPLLKRGMCGAAVTALQNRLVALRYRLGPAEQRGCFGEGTWYAVQAFQRDNNLGSDGEAGTSTHLGLTNPRKVMQRFGGHTGIHVEVFQGRGVVHMFRGNELIGAYASSTGASNATPNTPSGSYFTIKSKETRSWSYPYSVWLPWASYLSGPGLTEHSIAIHESPDVPDYPASHGCIRVPRSVSQQIFQNTPAGLKVYIVP